MTPKYSAQWWEKVAARMQQTAEGGTFEPVGWVERQRNPSLAENPYIGRKSLNAKNADAL